MKTLKSTALLLMCLLVLGCSRQAEVEPEFQLKNPICGTAKTYKDIEWLNTYINTLSDDKNNIAATIHYAEYKDTGYFEVVVPISSRWPYAMFTCDGKAVTFSNSQEYEAYFTEKTDPVLVWQFK